MAANSLQNLVLVWRLHNYSCYSQALPLHLAPQTFMQCNACWVQSFLPGALVRKNGDPQTGWMKEEERVQF